MADPNRQLRERVARFRLLRAAQRALACCMHPAILEPLRQEGRQLLIQLREVDQRPSVVRDDPRLAEIDRLLSHHLGGTLERIGQLEFAQLRAAGPALVRDKPEDLLALVEVTLQGGRAGGQQVRLVEYIVTMLCVEERKGRRRQVREPGELIPALREGAARGAAGATPDVDGAVTRLEAAAKGLARRGDHLALRDEIRGFKQELGASLLHPKILSAAVAYNVAMSNQASAQRDGTLALDELADDLLAGVASAPQGDVDLLYGRGMARLTAALRARIGGARCDDEAANRAVAVFEIDGLVSREIEALEDAGEDPLNRLIASAVVLGCVLRQRAALVEPLKALGLAADVLERDALPALLGEVGAASSKHFADGGYSEAFLLSEMKTRNLAAIQESAERRAREAGGGSRGAVDGASGRLPFGLSPARMGLVVGAVVGMLLATIFVATFGDGRRALSTSELSEISPFLNTGHRREEAGKVYFVGHLFPTWRYLGTPEREVAADEMAAHLAGHGVSDGVLLGVDRSVMARWQDGELVELTPKPQE
jgi:hypothetical protein